MFSWLAAFNWYLNFLSLNLIWIGILCKVLQWQLYEGFRLSFYFKTLYLMLYVQINLGNLVLQNILASTQCLAAMDFIVTWVTLFKQFTVCRSSSMYAVRAIACEAIYCKVLWQNCYDRCHNIRTVSLMVGKHQFLSHKEKDEGRDDGRTDGRRIQRSSCVSN